MPVLYSYFRSSCSWRVRAALAYKNIEYEYKAVNLLKGDQLSEEFSKINPLQEVPVLVEHGNIITHSLPIIEYLEEAHPQNPLLPSNDVLRAKVRAIAESIGSGIQPLQNLRILKQMGDKKDEWANQCIVHGFRGLEKLLQPMHGRYCVGDSVTIADTFLVPQIFNATSRFDVDMTEFPILSQINENLLSLHAFRLSHPYLQPDCPPELKRSLVTL